MHTAPHGVILARTEGEDGSKGGISCFVVPRETEGLVVEGYEWWVSHLSVYLSVYLSILSDTNRQVDRQPDR